MLSLTFRKDEIKEIWLAEQESFDGRTDGLTSEEVSHIGRRAPRRRRVARAWDLTERREG